MCKLFRYFRKSQEGSATVEFVVLFPAFIFLFLTGFESGYYMVRNVMLERAVDVAVRDVRLGNGRVPSFEHLKAKICNQAGIIPDCMNSLQIEMQPIPIEPGSTALVRGPAKCVDRLSTEDPRTGTTYEVGDQNSMMMVRVCALSQPLFPSTGIGLGMRVDAEGNYALVATTAFVNEPGNRSLAPDPVNPLGVSSPSQPQGCDAGIGTGSEGCDPGQSGSYNAAGDDDGEVAANTGGNSGSSGTSGSGSSGNGNSSSGSGSGTSMGGNSGSGGSGASLLRADYGQTSDALGGQN